MTATFPLTQPLLNDSVQAAAIDIDRLRVVRGRRTLLSVDRLAVAPGEVVTVLGPNGAGKSTLLKTLNGLVRPTSGSVCVLGLPVSGPGAAPLARLRRRVAYLAQLLAPGSEMPLTVREVVATGRTGAAGLFRPLRRDDWRTIDHWIERLGLAPFARQPYSLLSGGEQRKALLAMAMAQQPEVLLLDEPAANLDLYWREQIVATLESLYREQRMTIVLVCHELETIPPSCHRIVLLDRGAVAACGTAAEVLTPERVAAIYGRGLRAMCISGRQLLVPAVTEDD